MAEIIKTSLELTDELSDHQKAAAADKMAELSGEIAALEEKKKASADAYKAKISGKATLLTEELEKVRKGIYSHWEDCEVLLNTPEDGKKTITRLDLPENHDPAELNFPRSWETNMEPDDYRLFPGKAGEVVDANPFLLFGLAESDVVGIAEAYGVMNDPKDLEIVGEATPEDWDALQNKLVLKFVDEAAAKDFEDAILTDERPGDDFIRFGMSEGEDLRFIAISPLKHAAEAIGESDTTAETEEKVIIEDEPVSDKYAVDQNDEDLSRDSIEEEDLKEDVE